MIHKIVTWLAAPAMAAGILLSATPAHAADAVQFTGATVSGGSARTVNVTLQYSCDNTFPYWVRSAAVQAYDLGTQALGVTFFTPSCTGSTVTATIPVTAFQQKIYVAGHLASVHVQLLDGDNNEVVGDHENSVTLGSA